VTTGNIPKPLLYFAMTLIGSSVPGFGLLLSVQKDKGFDADFALFLIIMIIVHLLVGAGILSRKHWGFIIFKGYLYLLLLAIPIGTYISHKTLCYLKQDDVANLYK
jgi:hypothetical protein